jgi:3-dehydroquinate dehydratase type I
MICIPIIARTNEAAVAQMERSAPLADCLELRIDQIVDCDLKRLLAAGRSDKPVIVTNRRADEGGAFSGTERERVDLLKEAVALGADYVDIEARTEKPLLRELTTHIKKHQGRTKWIISSHDFDGTPPEGVLKEQFDACAETQADIVKICTYAHAMEDNLRVLGIIPYALKKDRAIIAFAMGEQGRISRVMAPLLGAAWGYASVEKGAEAAPGQLTIEEMNQIYYILGAAEGES